MGGSTGAEGQTTAASLSSGLLLKPAQPDRCMLCSTAVPACGVSKPTCRRCSSREAAPLGTPKVLPGRVSAPMLGCGVWKEPLPWMLVRQAGGGLLQPELRLGDASSLKVLSRELSCL